MGRLQDMQAVTPTNTDNILIVQSTGQGLASFGSTLGTKMDKANPTGTGSLSINRKSGTTTGSNSTTVGTDCEASGAVSFAEGYGTKASGIRSHAAGSGTIASHEAQFVFGEYNVEDTTGTTTTRGQYIEIVGKGVSANARSNARTLDWSGNEVLAGGLTTGGNLNTNGIITATFNSGNPLVIDTFQSYGSCIILGFVQGIGGVAILMQFTNNTIGRCINMYTGENFSNSNLSFSFSSHTLTITQTSAAVSTLTIIKTF